MLKEQLLQKINQEFESPIHSIAKSFREDILTYLDMFDLDDDTLQAYLAAEDSGRAVLRFFVKEEPALYEKVLEQRQALIEDELNKLLTQWEIIYSVRTGEQGNSYEFIRKLFSNRLVS